MEKLTTTIEISTVNFALTVFVNSDLSYKEGDGWITLMHDNSIAISDNLSYYDDFTKAKKRELKEDLKKYSYDPKGCVKELKGLLKQAKKLGIIKEEKK